MVLLRQRCMGVGQKVVHAQREFGRKKSNILLIFGSLVSSCATDHWTRLQSLSWNRPSMLLLSRKDKNAAAELETARVSRTLRKTCRLKRRCKQARKQSSARQGFVHWRQNTSSHAIFSQFLLVTPAHALFFLFFTFTRTCVTQALSKLCSSFLCAVYKSLFRPHTMTLLDVPHTTSSFCSTSPSLSPNRLHTTGVKSQLNVTPRLGGQSRHLVDTTQSTGSESKTCIDVSSEHTSINFPIRRDNFNLENDLKITVSEDSDHPLQRSTVVADIRWQALHQRCGI